MILPWIRIYNYIEDYFVTTYNYYAQCYPAYPVTYYTIDHENTIWEDNKIRGGSYENRGLGKLSGVKWKKILMFPIFVVEEMNPTYDSDERGLIMKDSLKTTIAFPSLYGLKPTYDDKIDLSYAFSNNFTTNIRQLFNINGISTSHVGEYMQMYQCSLGISGGPVSTIEKQISSYWSFYEHEKAILPLENSKILTQLQSMNNVSANKLNTSYNSQCGLFLT